MEKQCAVCGNKFQTRYPWQRCCSKKCKTKDDYKLRKIRNPQGIKKDSKLYKLRHPEKVKMNKQQWWKNNKDKISIKRKIWRKENNQEAKRLDALNCNKKRFGGNRQLALERDNFCCVGCGLNNEQHILLFGKGINVHHIDKNKKNQSLDNLKTLCVRCHTKTHTIIIESVGDVINE